MSGMKTGGIVVLVLVALAAYLSFFIVDPRQKAIVQRFGTINSVVENPGLYYKIPFADEVTMIEGRQVIWESQDKVVQVVVRPPWLSAVVDEPGVVVCTLPDALARYAAID